MIEMNINVLMLTGNGTLEQSRRKGYVQSNPHSALIIAVIPIP